MITGRENRRGPRASAVPGLGHAAVSQPPLRLRQRLAQQKTVRLQSPYAGAQSLFPVVRVHPLPASPPAVTAGIAGYLVYWLSAGDRTAAGMTVLAILLTVISLGLDGEPGSARVRWIRRAYLLTLIPIAAITAVSWTGLPSLLAGAGLALGCLGRWQTDAARFRLLMSASILPWLAHDVLTLAAASICADIFGIGRGAQMAWNDLAALRSGLPKPAAATGRALVAAV